jgi:transcription-repair coupling factor (superfamily II helicase)
MEVYKKIASIGSDEELEGITAELLDRFGPLPDECRAFFLLRKFGASAENSISLR